MDILRTLLIALVGFAFVYFILSSLISNDKLKKYTEFVISLCLLTVMISSVAKIILNTELDLSFLQNGAGSPFASSAPLLSTEQRAVLIVQSVLDESFSQFDFTVRAHISSGGVLRVYVTPHQDVDAATVEDIRNVISRITGISCHNVNIYLSNGNKGG